MVSAKEAKRRGELKCDRSHFPPVACGPCQRGPDSAVCVGGECVGVSQEHYLDAGCATDADCVLLAFAGCCACPTRWEPVNRPTAAAVQSSCASQACSLEASACQPVPHQPAQPRCVKSYCQVDR